MDRAAHFQQSQVDLEAAALAPAERLLLWSIRAWASVRRAGQRPEPLIGAALGKRSSARAAALFSAWMQAVEAAAGRRLQIQCAACAALCPDEARLLLACGLASVSMEAGGDMLRPILTDAEPAMALARVLNRVMAADGWKLPARLGFDFAEVRPISRTLH
jgi:hypothetical protein